MAKFSLLGMVQDIQEPRKRKSRLSDKYYEDIANGIPKATAWARENKDVLNSRYKKMKGTVRGKLISLITSSRDRAKKAGREHELDTSFLEGLYEGQGGKCALTGNKMLVQAPRDSDDFWYTISLDRVDSTKGYLRDNVQLVCTGVNLMKKDMPEVIFVAFCKSVLEVCNG